MDAMIKWIASARCLHVIWPETVDIETIEEFNTRIMEHYENGIKPFHVILDIQFIKSYPKDIQAIASATPFLTYETEGWFIAVTGDKFIRFIAQGVIQILSVTRSIKFRTVSNLQDAFTILRILDRSVEWNSV